MNGLFKSITTAVSGNAINSIVNLLFVVVFVNKFGLEAFGSYGWYQAILLTSVILAKPNVWQALATFYSTSPIHKKKSELFTFFCLDACWGIFSLAICIPVFFLVINSDYLLLLIPYILFFNNGFAIGYLRSTHKFHLYAVTQVASALVKLVIVMFAPMVNVNDYITIVFFCDGLVWLSLYIYVLKNVDFKIGRSNFVPIFEVFSKNVFQSKGKFVFGTYLSSVLDLPVSHLDKLIVGSLLSEQLLGLYVLLRRLAVFFSVLVEPISYVFLPEFARNLKDGNVGKALNARLIFLQMITVFSFGLFSSVFAYFAFDFVNELLFSNQMEGHRDLVLLTICIQALGLMFTWVNPMVTAKGLLKHNNVVMLLSNTVYLISLWVLCGSLGLFGALIAIGVQYFMVAATKIYLIIYFPSVKFQD